MTDFTCFFLFLYVNSQIHLEVKNRKSTFFVVACYIFVTVSLFPGFSRTGRGLVYLFLFANIHAHVDDVVSVVALED